MARDYYQSSPFSSHYYNIMERNMKAEKEKFKRDELNHELKSETESRQEKIS